jgi:hypothetical protein
MPIDRRVLIGFVGMGACAAPAPREPISAPPLPVATAAAAPSPDAGVDISQTYVHDVWLVTTRPSAVFLLATFEEPAGDACEARLLAHARTLGANRLYVDRAVPCGGSAFFVRGSAAPDATSQSLHARPTDEPSITAWVRARWKRPASISEDESRKLCVVVQFTVSPMRRVLDVRGQPIRSSGSAAFDESVRAAIESAIDEHATVPKPPHELVGEVVVYRIELTEGNPAVCRSGTPR